MLFVVSGRFLMAIPVMKESSASLTEPGTPLDPRYEEELRLELSKLLNWQNPQV